MGCSAVCGCSSRCRLIVGRGVRRHRSSSPSEMASKVLVVLQISAQSWVESKVMSRRSVGWRRRGRGRAVLQWTLPKPELTPSHRHSEQRATYCAYTSTIDHSNWTTACSQIAPSPSIYTQLLLSSNDGSNISDYVFWAPALPVDGSQHIQIERTGAKVWC